MMRISKKYVLFVAILVTVLLELIFRNYDLDQIRGIIRDKSGDKLKDCLVLDSELDHRLLPNCGGEVKTKDFAVKLKTNNLGFRDKDVASKNKDVRRVLIVGDSFAEGWGVDVNDRFDQIKSDSYEFINFGTRSYSPYLELKLIKKYVDQINPDVVVTFLDFSDLHDDYYYQRRPLYSSKLFETIYIQYSILRANNEKKINDINLTYDFTLFAKAQDWDNYNESWNLTRKKIEETREFLKSKNIDYKVAVVPRGMHVGENEWDEGRRILGLERNKIYTAPEIFNISDIDLLTPLKSAESKFNGQLYYPFDGHWTVLGHGVVRQVFQRLIDNKEL